MFSEAKPNCIQVIYYVSKSFQNYNALLFNHENLKINMHQK